MEILQHKYKWVKERHFFKKKKVFGKVLWDKRKAALFSCENTQLHGGKSNSTLSGCLIWYLQPNLTPKMSNFIVLPINVMEKKTMLVN